jgi:hypothetical protein
MNMTARTTVPLWAVLASVPTFIGAIMWISFIAYNTNANADSIKELQITKDKHLELLIQIKEDVASIKAKIERIK